jgi:predicted dehydrogenase
MLNLGIIGCGRVTTMFHLKAVKTLDKVVIKAVADVDPDRRLNVMKKAKAESAYDDYRDLLSNPNVDLVAINTPPRFHEKMTLDSLDSGKHVLCEKPLSQTVEGCKRIKTKKNQTGLHVVPVHNYLFTPSLLRMVDLFNENVIGELDSVKIVFSNNLRGYRSHSDFRLLKFNGIVEDVLPHTLSVASPFTGASIGVDNLSWSCKSYEICDNLNVSFGTERGVRLNCAMSWTGVLPRFQVILQGVYGTLKTDLMLGPYSVELKNEKGSKKFRERGPSWLFDLVMFKHPSFQNQYKHLVSLIEGEETVPKVSIDDEISILNAIDLVSERLTR